jgi:phosphodiesterase/alkaline phosphatase D-like protein
VTPRYPSPIAAQRAWATGPHRRSSLLLLAFLWAGAVAPLGPAAAQSPSGTEVAFVWSGAVTTTSAVVKAKVTGPGAVDARLLIGDAADLTDATEVQAEGAPSGGGIVSFVLEGLEPVTEYHYAIRSGDAPLEDAAGTFRTFPAGPESFTVALGACATTGSDHPVFETIADHDPLLFLHMGDFHYEDIETDEPTAYQEALEAVLTAPRQAALHRSTPMAYVWDDHDYGKPEDRHLPGRAAARTTYQEYVPHYPLAAGSGDVPISQAFDVGRVRFIMTDNRSERDGEDVPADDTGKTMLGAEQKAWLKDQLLAARDGAALAVWVNTVPWIVDDRMDSWSGFVAERRELANFIADEAIDNLVMVSGDAHMLAIDDGTNNTYSDSGATQFPVFHAAALDREGSVKGGPYSHGTFPGLGQFGLMTVTDEGSEIHLGWSGRDHEDREIIAHRMSFPAAGVLTGTVVDAATGDALAGVDVRARMGAHEVTTSTDASGRYEMQVPAGTHALSVGTPRSAGAAEQVVAVGPGQSTSTDLEVETGRWWAIPVVVGLSLAAGALVIVLGRSGRSRA